MLNVKQLVLVAMYAEGIHENSFVRTDGEGSIGCHRIPRSDAVLKAAEKLGWLQLMDEVDRNLAGIMIHDCWNEVQDWFEAYFGFDVQHDLDEAKLEAFILKAGKECSPEEFGRLPDSSNVYSKDILDPEHQWGSKDLLWVFECEGEPSIEFATEDEACAAQRAYRRKHNYNPYNGLPNF